MSVHPLPYRCWYWSDPAYTAGALKANETREIRFTFTEEIVTLNCLAIEIITGNATITGCEKDSEDSKILVLTIQAKYGGVGTISLVIGSGAVAYENETKTVEFKLDFDSFKLLDRHFEWIVENGEFEILVGASSNDIRLKETIEINIKWMN